MRLRRRFLYILYAFDREICDGWIMVMLTIRDCFDGVARAAMTIKQVLVLHSDILLLQSNKIV